MSTVIKQLFTERFRPKELSTLILPDRIRDEVSKGLIQHLLLSGHPGTGKTSLAFIISKDHPTLLINARQEANVDLVRNKLYNFCSVMSLDGGKENLKCVVIEEFDAATPAFFDAIKVPMEKYVNTVRYIATTNYINKIPEGILSRYNCISFDPINKEEETYIFNEYKKRMALILKAAKITYTDEIFEKFIKNYFPDMRSLLNRVQSLYIQGITKLDEKNFNINFDYEDLYKLCLSKPDKPYENYKFITNEYSNRVDDALNTLGNDFIDYIKQNAPNKIDKIPLIIIAVAEHQAQRINVIDPLITLLSCCLKLQIILNS
jgi:DNA polymerase III delta prime subunit